MNPYEIMYVIPKEQYVSHQSPPTTGAAPSTAPTPPSSLCSVDGRDFKHPNILAHHMKEHSGPKCNICGKSFKHRASLRKHLRRHRPQAGPPAARAGPPPPRAGPPAARVGPPPPRAGPPAARARPSAPPPELRCGVCNRKMKHKRNLTRHMKSHIGSISFKATKWETL
jgi:hypothetical protein